MFISFSGACFSFTSAYINVNHVIEQKNIEKISKNILIDKFFLLKGEKIYDELIKQNIQIDEARKLRKIIDNLINLDMKGNKSYLIYLYSHYIDIIKSKKIYKIVIHSDTGNEITIEYNNK